VRCVPNAALAEEFGIETSDEWIIERTGIRQRHIAAPGETASSMGTAAARQALERAGIDVAAVDAIIVATSTPDSAFPATAVRVQQQLGVTQGFAFDIAAACTGFIYGLGIADSLIRTAGDRDRGLFPHPGLDRPRHLRAVRRRRRGGGAHRQ
jgi:3-oxoacyl-[acyl-carrier-protein] synthase-3